MKRIITTGSGGPAGINFIKSLGDAPEKIYVIGTDVNKHHLELVNADEKCIIPRSDSSDYIEKLNSLINMTKADIVHPQPDSEVRILSENRKKINAMLFLPEKRTVRICQDKHESAKAWKKAGLPISHSIEIRDEADMITAEEKFGLPYWLRAKVGFSSRGSTLVRNRKTAIHWIGYWKSRGSDWNFIAQEYLPGKNIAFQSVWKDGELITSQARERLEYLYPYLAPSGVTNTPIVAKTIHRNDVNKMATDCVLAIDKNATGIFCVDLKENKDGVPIPTEINTGRFFTTSYFFTKAGINMPYYYLKLAYNEKIPELPKYNALPKDLYWIRHMDAPAILKKGGEWNHSVI